MPRRPVCIECKRRPPARPRRRCSTCQLRHEPIGEQVAAARLRLAMVPEELRLKRTKKVQAMAPAGTAWCAGCQSFRDHEDFGSKATTCKPCSSARSHAAMAEKTYGISGAEYDRLLKLQGGRCAICRTLPRSKRLAIDHDHKTGAVRGLLCAGERGCNKSILGGAHDDLEILRNAVAYMETPPADGAWLPPEQRAAERPSAALNPDALVVAHGKKTRESPGRGPAAAGSGEVTCSREHFFPVGSEPVPGKPGLYRVYASGAAETTPPF